MGTDIFLYKKNSDVDKDSPQGYLRANIWQERENAFLRMIFPEKFWVEKLDERGFVIPQRYQFSTEGLEVLIKISKHFENSVVCGADFKKFSFPGFEKIFGGMTLVQQPGLDTKAGLYFLESLIKFYRKGMELERKGQKPEVVIHW